jgi:hypothetical protein
VIDAALPTLTAPDVSCAPKRVSRSAMPSLAEQIRIGDRQWRVLEGGDDSSRAGDFHHPVIFARTRLRKVFAIKV